MHGHRTWTLSLFCAVSVLPTIAIAQTAARADAATGVEEIIVTAQRREERLQEVPITIAAASASRLERSGVVSAVDLQTIVPGLQMAAVRHNIQPYLRGVGTQNTSPGEEGSIATYVDGVYINYMASATFALMNVERIEVLNGPQGTLFGRNATGGMINVVTRTPEFDNSFAADLSYGNFNTIVSKFYMTGQVAPNMAASLAVYHSQQADGWGKNLLTGEDVNLKQEAAVSAKLMWNSPWGTRFLAQADLGRSESDVGTTRTIYPGTTLTGGIAAGGDPFDSVANDRNSAKVTYDGAWLKAEHDLGWAEISSLTAFRRVREKISFDQDGGPLRTSLLLTRVPVDTLQQELTFSGENSRLTWTAGLFYYRSWAGYQPNLNLSAVAASNRSRESYLRTEAYAAYAQATYALTGATNLTAGYRVSEDNRRINGVQRALSGNQLPPGTVLGASAQSASFTEPAWRVSLDHQFSSSLMVYLSRSRGFKSGTFSATSFENPAVEPETLNATEVGVKSTLLDGKLLLNASAFEYSYKNIQLAQVIGGVTSRLLNAAQGSPKGANVDFSFRDRVGAGILDFSASAVWLEAKYDSFPGAPAASPRPGGGNVQFVIDATGYDMVRSPRFTSEVSADYEVPIGNGAVGASVTWAHNSGFYTDPDNAIKQPAFDLVNLRARFKVNQLEFYAYAQNVTDEIYLSSLSHTNLGDLATFGPPNTYGVGIKAKF